MDPASIALAIEGARQLVRGAKNIGQIVHGIDSVVHAENEHAKNKKKKR